MQDLPENHLRVSEASWVNIIRKKKKKEETPDLRVDFFEFLDEGKRQLEKDEHDRDKLNQEVN